MSKIIFQNIVRFILLIFFQVLVLDYIRLGNYATPFFYVLFIIMLPVNTSKWLLLISSFLLGFFIDQFSSGISGFHAFASTLTAFLRIFIIRFAFSQAEREEPLTPNVQTLKIKTVIGYTATLVFIHHLFYFLIESFSFGEIFQILLRTILSSLITVILILIYQFLFIGIKKIG